MQFFLSTALMNSLHLFIAKVFCHKEARACARTIEATELGVQAEKEKLEVLEMRSEEIQKAQSEAIVGEVRDSSGRLIDQNSLGIPRSNLGYTVMAVQLDEFVNEMESPGSGLVKSPTVAHLEEFHNSAKNVSKYVSSLLFSKEIIHKKHRDKFVDNIISIAQELGEILYKMNNMFALWSRYARQDTNETRFLRLKKEVEEVTRSFILHNRKISKCIQEVMQLLEKRYDKNNGKWLQKWQKDGDRVLQGSTWAGRPLATISEVKEVIQKLEGITDAILKISTEVMPPLLEYGGESGRYGLPNDTRSGREASRTVPESLLTMINTALFAESISLKGFSSKDSVHKYDILNQRKMHGR